MAKKKNDHRKGAYQKELRDLAVELKKAYGSKRTSEALVVSPSSLHNWCKDPISQKALPLKTASATVMPFVELKHSGKYVAPSIEILLPSSFSLKISKVFPRILWGLSARIYCAPINDSIICTNENFSGSSPRRFSKWY